jgi:hypothetical protein
LLVGEPLDDVNWFWFNGDLLLGDLLGRFEEIFRRAGRGTCWRGGVRGPCLALAPWNRKKKYFGYFWSLKDWFFSMSFTYENLFWMTFKLLI